MAMAKRRILFLTVIPSPYQRQLFDRLAKAQVFDVRVLYYAMGDRKSTRLNSSHVKISYAVSRLLRSSPSPYPTLFRSQAPSSAPYTSPYPPSRAAAETLNGYGEATYPFPDGHTVALSASTVRSAGEGASLRRQSAVLRDG